MFKIDPSSYPSHPLMSDDEACKALIVEGAAFRDKFADPQNPDWPVQHFMVAAPSLVYRFAPYTGAIEQACDYFGFPRSHDVPALLARLVTTNGSYRQTADDIAQLLHLHRCPEWAGKAWQLSALYYDASANSKARGDD